MVPYWSAPALWPDSTIVCIGGGPSLTAAQVEACRDRLDKRGFRVRAIAVNNAYVLAPWADVLYFCDCKWWRWHHQKLTGWKGMIVRMQGGAHDFGDARIKVLRNLDVKGGLADRRDGLHNGQNGGYQAINLAVHLGAKKIVLLGYDMHAPLVNGRPQTHWFGDHPGGTNPSVYDTMLPWFETLVRPLEKRGIEIVNCTPGSAIRVFPRKPLQDALPATLQPVCADEVEWEYEGCRLRENPASGALEAHGPGGWTEVQ